MSGVSSNIQVGRVEPALYLERLETMLSPLRDTDYYPGLWRSYTDIQRFDHHLHIIAPHVSLAGKSVLDMGAGTGGLLLACQQRGAARLVGVEVSQELHELAQLRLISTGIESLLTDGLTVPLPDSSFDVIFSIHTIEHAQWALRYLSEIARLLKPSGVVLLSCPNRIWPHEPHANLPFLPYLPMWLSKKLCYWRNQSMRLSPRIKRQYYTGTLLEHYFSFFGVRRLCHRVGLDFIEINHPARFDAVPEVSFGAWGETHLRFEKAFNALNRTLIHDRIAPYVRAHPLSHVTHWLAILLSWEICGVLRKPTIA